MSERPTDGPLIDAIDRLTKQPTGRPVIFTCFYLLDVKGLDGQTDGLTDERTDKRTKEWMGGWTNGRTDERRNGRAYGGPDG